MPAYMEEREKSGSEKEQNSSDVAKWKDKNILSIKNPR